ncbi:microprocessor complex subunit DGCR8 [Vanessa atalanta]|uniref:microprocessor complex subunit DGCR8 n=1 Tax=Vanessa atalanta TaxID=42275 RepID=UPI001FCD0372|nr:microprocessor complex subunit DGCR8 [Vanessa atalanta]
MNEETELAQPPAKRQKIEDEDGTADVTENIDFTEDVAATEEKFKVDNKYENFVTPEELEKLKEFKVLDEVKSNDGDSNADDSDTSEGKSEELPEEEIEKMLDENLPEDFKGTRKPKDKPYVTRTKIFLEEKGINQFEILPLDWMMVRHYSGMPLYMHRPTRVCTLSKPYFLGKGNTRRHDIPISAIPCLAYRRALEEEEKQKEIDRRVEEQIKNKTWAREGDNAVSEIKAVDPPNDREATKESTETSAPGGKCPFSHMNGTSDDVSKDVPTETPARAYKESTDDRQPKPSDEHQPKPTDEQQPKPTDEQQTEQSDEQQIKQSDEQQTKQSDEQQTEPSDEQQQIRILDTIKEENDVEVTESGMSEVASEAVPSDAGEGSSLAAAAAAAAGRAVQLPDGRVMPAPRVESVDTSWKTQHLTAEQIHAYCKSLFKFKTVNFMHFNRWADRRKYTKARKALQYPKLPEGTKLITIPATSSGQENGAGGKAKRDWVMNMNGCSYLSEFHEYVCRALQKQPVYEYKQLENASSPYQATVYIGGMQYGVGHGSSKRQAKYAAARASIQTLIPEMRQYLEPEQAACAKDPKEPDFSFFDYVGIEDPRIAEFCAATCEPSPHAILLTCLLRNFGAGDWHVNTEMKKLEYQKIELTMRVGKHTATVVCKNKKTAKQRASQAILQALHPHVRSWGSLLRLYGSRSVKSCKEKKLEEQQITLLQDKARHNEPNYAVLEKLRNEMRKLRERDESVVPIGTLLLADHLPSHSASNLNNVDL